MTPAEYKKAEAFLILKYSTVGNAIDHWLDTDEEEEGFDMMDFYLAQPPKDRTE